MTTSWWDPTTESALDAVLEHEDAAAAVDVGPSDPGEYRGPDIPPRLHYGSVDEFVREYLRHSYRRRIDGRNRVWAARWWEHEEAIARLEALWRAWEASRLDGAGATIGWWREADHHMAVLMDTSGPFASSSDTNAKNDPLPYEAPPAGMFPDVRDAI